MNLKKIKDSLGYPETLDEVQDWGLDARTILESFDSWATQDMLNDFMQHLADEFDMPESLDDGVCDYIDHTYDGNDRDVVRSLDKFLTQDQLDEFIGELDRDHEFSAIR